MGVDVGRTMGKIADSRKVPATPFTELVNALYEQERGRNALYPGEVSHHISGYALLGVARRLGWLKGDEADKNVTRTLYRYRYQRKETKATGSKGQPVAVVEHAYWWQSTTVEEALHALGHDMRTYYEDWAARYTGRRGAAHDVCSFLKEWEHWDKVVERLSDDGLTYQWCAPCGEVTTHDERGKCCWCIGQREYARKQRTERAERVRREEKRTSYAKAKIRRTRERVAA